VRLLLVFRKSWTSSWKNLNCRITLRKPGNPTDTILKAETDAPDRFPAFLAFRGYRRRRLRRHRRRRSSTVGPTIALTTGRRTKHLLFNRPAPTSQATSATDTAAHPLIQHHTAGIHLRRTTEHDALRNRSDSNQSSSRQYTDVRNINEVQQGSPTYDIAACRRNHYDCRTVDCPSFVPPPTFSFCTIFSTTCWKIATGLQFRP